MHLRAVIVSFLLALVLLPSAGHAQVRCGPEIDRQLQRLDVPKSTVKSIDVKRDSTQEGALQGYIAWLRLGQCRGHLVMSMTTYCLVSSAYTTGDCQVRGVTNY